MVKARKTNATKTKDAATLARRKAHLSLPRRLFAAFKWQDDIYHPNHANLCREAARVIRDGRKDLSEVTIAVYAALGKLDAAMKGPSTDSRGRQVAAIANDLQMAADRAWHFGLGNDLPGPGGATGEEGQRP